MPSPSNTDRTRGLAALALACLLAACGGGYSSGGGGGGGGPYTYAISGTATASGAGVAGVTVTLSGAASAVTTTAVDGSYSFGGLGLGRYQVTPSIAGHGFSPVATVVSLGSANSPGHDFARGPAATLHSISGTVTGASPYMVTITLGGDNSGAVLTSAGGAYTIAGLRVGDYTLTPSYGSYSFAPTMRAVAGVHGFEHNLSGGLGNASLVSVLYNGDPVVPFFEMPNPEAVELTGTIRARRTSEIAAPDLAAFQDMWTVGGTVEVTYLAIATEFHIDINLADYPHFTLSSADSFTFTESLILATGNDFASTP